MAALQTVGAFLVIAMVVTPGATAYLLCDRFPRLLMVSVSIGALTSFVGAYLSYFLDGATGGLIITLQTLVFLTVFVWRRSTDCWRRNAGPPQPCLSRFRDRRRMRPAGLPPEPGRPRDGPAYLSLPFPLHAERLPCRAAAGAADGDPVMLSGAERLVADGRCHQPCGSAGVVIAYMLNIPLLIGAFGAGMTCALATGYLKENSRVKQDTVMGVVFSGMFGFGLVLYTKITTNVHLDHILFGNMLGIGPEDLLTAGLISVCVTGLLLVFWKDLLLHAFDPAQARAIGLPVRLLHYGLLTVLSLTIVGTLKAVGLILAVGLLIGPGAIAFLVTRRFAPMMLVAVTVTVISLTGGIYLSFFLDSAPAPTAILLLTGIFFLAFLVKLRRQAVDERQKA